MSSTSHFSSSNEPAFGPHPRPHVPTDAACERCGGVLKAPFQVRKGEQLENWGRWLQICFHHTPVEFIWRTAQKTDIKDIPEDIQLAYAVRQSAAEASGNGTLACVMPNCLTASGKPRRANKDCTHTLGPCCGACCKRGGGCDLPAHKPASQAAIAAVTSNVVVPSPSTQPPVPAASVQAPQYLARGIDSGYASFRLDRHTKVFETTRKLEEEQNLLMQIENSVSISFFSEPGRPPILINDVTEHPGKFVPAKSLILGKYLGQDDCISFLHAVVPRREWRIQGISHPIVVSGDGRVFIRRDWMTDTDCLNFEAELYGRDPDGGAQTDAKHNPTAIKLSTTLLVDRTSGPRYIETSDSETSPPERRSVQDCRPISSLPFPLTFAADMIPKMEVLIAFQGNSDALIAAFAREFRGCTFRPSTVYKHLAIYRDAKKYNVVERFLGLGNTAAGRWTNLRKDVEYLRMTGGVPFASPEDLISPNAGATTAATTSTSVTSESANIRTFKEEDNEVKFVHTTAVPSSGTTASSVDSLEYSIRFLKLSHYTMEQGQIKSYCPPDRLETEFIFWDPAMFQGHAKQIFMVEYTEDNGNTKTTHNMALKKLAPLDPLWWKPYISEDLAIWLEGSRLAQFYFDFLAFRSKSIQLRVRLSAKDIDVLETVHLSGQRGSWIGQPWKYGRLITSDILANKNTAKVLLHDTLGALSHFTYAISEGNVVHTDFQGFLTPPGIFNIFDCVSHKRLDIDTPDGYPFLGGAGAHGVEEFERTHDCTLTCFELGLTFIVLNGGGGIAAMVNNGTPAPVVAAVASAPVVAVTLAPVAAVTLAPVAADA